MIYATFCNFFCNLQAGLIGLLVAQFRLPILVAIAYLCLSIAYHVSSLNTRW